MKVREQLIQINDYLQYRTIGLAAQADYNAIVDESGLYDVMDQNALIQKCSAKTGEGLSEGFKKLFNFLDNNSKQSQFVDNDAMSDSRSFHFNSDIKQ